MAYTKGVLYLYWFGGMAIGVWFGYLIWGMS